MHLVLSLSTLLATLALLAAIGQVEAAALSDDRLRTRPLLLPAVAPGANFGRFPDSRVTAYDRWTIRESAEGLPDNILPAFVGSGRLGAGLDASGLQNLDCRVADGPRYTGLDWQHKDDLYVFHEGMIADHITRGNLMPLGRLLYTLEVDGELVDERHSAVVWTREVDLRRACVRTTLSLREGVAIRIDAFAPHGEGRLLACIEVRSTDGRPHFVRLAPELALTLRARNGGGAILDRVLGLGSSSGAAWLSGSVASSGPRRSHEDYRVRCSLAVSAPARAFASPEGLRGEVAWRLLRRPRRLAVEWRFEAPHAAAQTERPVSLTMERFRAAKREHEADWRRFHERSADIRVGDPLREMLFRNSLYVMRSGSTFASGVPLQFLLFHPENWYGCTFWDLVFAADALVRCGHADQAVRAARWLQKVMSPVGRPFHWLTRYDGSSAMPAGQVDSGYMVNASHAMTAIRAYEAAGDRALLREVVYPIVRTVAEYAVADRMVREGDRWIGAGAGLDANTPLEVNDTYSATWFGVILRKAAEYARALGVDNARREEWQSVARGLWLERGPDGYHQSRSTPRPGGWVSMLLYPTEALPLLDVQVFRRNRARQSFLFDYHVFQPWCYFWHAVSDLRLGSEHRQLAQDHIEEGIRAVYGPGYFSEILPAGVSVEGLPPYLSAHSSYLAATAEQLVGGDVWSDVVRVFEQAPDAWLRRPLRFAGLCTPRGVEVSGHWQPGHEVACMLRGRGRVLLRLRAPQAGAVLTVGGRPTPVSWDGAIACLEMRLDASRWTEVRIRARPGVAAPCREERG